MKHEYTDTELQAATDGAFPQGRTEDIQLVEKRELDQLLERLAEARDSHLAASSRDVQTIQRQAILLERMAGALKEIAWIKETGHRDYSWTGDVAFAAFSAYESANLRGAAMSDTLHCYWKEDEDGNWETSCERCMVFEYGPTHEQGYNFCHHCGKPIHFIKFTFIEEQP